jgi:hypothetical protein
VDFIKLRNQSGVFIDPETGFSLKFDQEKPFPESLGRLTRNWLTAGGLIKIMKNTVKTPNPSPVSPIEAGDSNQTQPTEELQESDNNLEKRFDGLSVSDLRKLCKQMDLTYSPRQNASALIKRILDFEAKAKQ